MSQLLKDFLINFHGHVLIEKIIKSSNEKEGHEWVCFLIVCDVKLVVQLSCLSGHVRRQPRAKGDELRLFCYQSLEFLNGLEVDKSSSLGKTKAKKAIENK